MNLRNHVPSRAAAVCLITGGCLFLLAACGGSPPAAPTAADARPGQEQPVTPPAPTPGGAQPTQEQPAATVAPQATSPQVPASQVDACSLLTQTEVETAAGRSVLPPKSEQVANLACCSYSDPETPIVSAATLCVFVGSDVEYSAGAVAQAREVFETSQGSAAAAQAVSGLGDAAYWDETFGDLHVLTGPYEVTLEITRPDDDDVAALAAAKALAAQVLQRLAQ